VRSPTRFVALTAGLAVAVALLPVDVLAQRGRGGGGGGGGRGGGGGGAVARSGPSHAPGGGGPRASGGGPYRGPSGGSSASARSPYYRGGPNSQGYRTGGSYGHPNNGYGHPGNGYNGYRYGGYRYGGYGYSRYGHGYYRPYYGHGYYGYYRPYYGYGYGYYGYPYWGFGFSWGYPYWGAYAWGYPYVWGGYGGGYVGGGYDSGDYQGGARLEVKPRQTEVFVDGYYAGVVDNFDGFSQKLKLEPGEHEVTLFLDGYRPLTRRMLFTAGQTIRVEHQMEPLGAGEPPPQRPVPTARPQQAPARTRYMTPGMQRQVSGRPDDPSVDPGTRPADHAGDITVIEPSEPRPRTEPPASPEESRGPSGTLAIRVQPDDAEIVIDGEPWARSGGERLVVALAPGVHRLEVRRSGHETYVGLVRIRPGVATTLNVALATTETR